jgi:hypothetical protein
MGLPEIWNKNLPQLPTQVLPLGISYGVITTTTTFLLPY